MNAITELAALWIGIRPGQFSVTSDGDMVIKAMRRGQRIPIKNGDSMKLISYRHHVVGYGHIVCSFNPTETVHVDTRNLEGKRQAIKNELARLGVTGQVFICFERITPLDGHNAV